MVGQIHYCLAGARSNLLLLSGLSEKRRFWDTVHVPLSEQYAVLSMIDTAVASRQIMVRSGVLSPLPPTHLC
jgi:hypothetical protein